MEFDVAAEILSVASAVATVRRGRPPAYADREATMGSVAQRLILNAECPAVAVKP
jgi:nucleotide-binding universal stress UspA family protein